MSQVIITIDTPVYNITDQTGFIELVREAVLTVSEDNAFMTLIDYDNIALVLPQKTTAFKASPQLCCHTCPEGHAYRLGNCGQSLISMLLLCFFFFLHRNKTIFICLISVYLCAIVSPQCDAQLPSVCRARRRVSPLLQSVPQSSRASSLIPLPAFCHPVPLECLVPNTSSRSSTVHSGHCSFRGLTTVSITFHGT